MSELKVGDKVRFKAGPRSTGLTEAKITSLGSGGPHGNYLTTKDDAGTERKVRPGACTKI